MRKQTLILTGWLAMPFICLTILMFWIFTSLDKDKLMADAPPVGAGAGDTGNANALGQLLAGRDPDAVAQANRAIRERIAIDPRDWPGGVLLSIPMNYVGEQKKDFIFHILQEEQDAVEYVQVYVDPNEDGHYELPLQQWQITGGTFGVLRRDELDEVYVFPLVLPMTTPPLGIQSSDPLPVLVRTGSKVP